MNDLAGQLLNDPAHLFEGRIFYPFTHTLAFVDHQMTNALLALPLVASGQDPIVVYNVVLLLTFFLSGVFCYWLVHGLTDSVPAGLVAGSLFAFSTYRFHHHEHLHLLGTQWLPLALLALHRFLARPTWVRLIGLGVSALLVAFASWQLAVIGAYGLGMASIATVLADGRPLFRRVWALVGVAALVGLSLVPLGAVYANAAADWGRPDGEPTGARVEMSVRPASFVALPAGFRIPYAPLFRGDDPPLPAFPGLVGAVLALLAVWTLLRSRPDTSRGWTSRALVPLGCLPAGVSIVAAELGPRGQWVVETLRPIGPVVVCGGRRRRRCTSRATNPRRKRNTGDHADVHSDCSGRRLARAGSVCLRRRHESGSWCVLARPPPAHRAHASARAVHTLVHAWDLCACRGGAERSVRHRRSIVSVIMSGVAIVALNVDIRQAPLAFGAAPTGRSEVYTWLAEAPEQGAVLEYPWDNRWSVYNNLAHGRRMVHGRAYLWPHRVRALQELPALSPRHLTQLWEHFHPRFIVLRAGLYPPEVRADVMRAVQDQPRALRLRARFEEDYVYELVDRGVGARLFRVWPKEELEHRRGFAMTGRVTGAREGTVPRLVVRLNGFTMLDGWGAEVERPYPRMLWIDPEQVASGLNVLQIFAGYRFADGAPGYAIGATGVSLAADVVVTAGRDRAMVEVNGQVEPVARGYLIAVLDADTGEIADIASFDTSAYRDESERLAAFIDDIPVNSPVLVSSRFDVSRQLTESAVQALRTLGLREDLRGRFNWIHAAIGAKGAPPGSALEGVDRQASRIRLGELAHPRVELRALSLH